MTDDIDARVAAADPVPQAVVDAAALHGADVALFDAIVATPSMASLPRTASRRRRARVAQGVLAVAATLALTAAGWATIRAHTGLFGHAGREEGPGELIRLDAPDAAAAVDRLGARVTLPPGHSFAGWKTANLRGESGTGAPGVLMTESGITAALSVDAACQWTAYWVDAYRTSDAAAMARAESVLRAIPDWPAVVASDPTGNVRALLRRRAAGATAHDPAVFTDEFHINCPAQAGPG